MSKLVVVITGDDLRALYQPLIVEEIADVHVLRKRLKWKRVKVERALRFLRLQLEGNFAPIVNPFEIRRVQCFDDGKYVVEAKPDAYTETTQPKANGV